MTRDDIIRMALEARLAFDCDDYPDIWQTYMNVGREEIERFAALVAAAEREACAKLIELHGGDDRFGPAVTIERLVAAIRARGQEAPSSAP